MPPRDVFVSYSHGDRDLARRLVDELEARGLSAWIDERELLVGDSLVQRIAEAIDRAEFFLPLVSTRSLQSSWCQRELGQAVVTELEQRRGVRVLPLLVGRVDVPITLKAVLAGRMDPADPGAAADAVARSVAGHRARRAPQPP